MFSSDKEKISTLSASLCLVVSLLLLRLSQFSASAMVNFENYIIKTMILSTANMNTAGAIFTLISPFILVFISLLFFVLSLSILSYHGYRHNDNKVGKLSGIAGAVAAVVLFQTIWGAFLAAAVFLVCFYSAQFSNMYGKELKRWVFFRTGSHTVGKMLLAANIIIAVGLFFAVLSSQSLYEASFRHELTDSMKSIAASLPGASSIPSDVLDKRIESVIASSSLFTAYIRWLPVTIAFSAWVLLEVLRNIILSHAGGLFTYLMLKRSERK